MVIFFSLSLNNVGRPAPELQRLVGDRGHVLVAPRSEHRAEQNVVGAFAVGLALNDALGEAHVQLRVWKRSADGRLGPSRTSR